MKVSLSNVGKLNAAALALTVFACSAMIGDVTHFTPLKGIGAASTMAPFPKVFCDNEGLEGFASDFTITARSASGVTTIVLTPQRYAAIKGPYNRRNVYGAVLAFGPKLPPKLMQSVFAYGLGPCGSIRDELGIPAGSTNVVVTIKTKTSGRADKWTLTSQ